MTDDNILCFLVKFLFLFITRIGENQRYPIVGLFLLGRHFSVFGAGVGRQFEEMQRDALDLPISAVPAVVRS